ncbi:MAG: hypothetical protein OEW99_00450 [Gammaproteobacteria bacterium]|nr:hypothetical protein [Gammaproteobacteria bacterium]
MAASSKTSDSVMSQTPTQVNTTKQEATPLIKPKNTTSENWIDKPPAWVIWGTVALALFSFLNLIRELIKDILNKKNEKKNKELSVKDEFWNRTIIFPIFIEPLVVFSLSNSTKLKKIKSDVRTEKLDELKEITKSYYESFDAEINELYDSCLALKIIGQEVYDEVNTCLEEIDDTVSTYCAKINIASDKNVILNKVHMDNLFFMTKFTEIINKLIDKHNNYSL